MSAFSLATVCEGAFRLSFYGAGASGPEWLADNYFMYGHVKGLVVMNKRTLPWMSSFSVTSLSRLRNQKVFGRLSTVMWTLRSSRGCPHPTGFGRTSLSLYVVTLGRGFHRRTLGILSRSVGRGELPRHPVCVFLLTLPLSFFFVVVNA